MRSLIGVDASADTTGTVAVAQTVVTDTRTQTS
jgi:hypothetical protein